MKQVSEIKYCSNAALYGTGVFTTIAIVHGEPVFWDKHVSRLTANADAIGLSMPSADSLWSGIRQKLTEASLSAGRARITLLDNTGASLWSDGENRETSVGILVGKHRDHPATFRIRRSEFIANSRSPLAGIKSCNYLENIMALRNARDDGFDEALRLNERGEVTSGACANIFWIREKVIFTPALETGCLAGTTRGFIVDNFDVEEVTAGIDAVESADAMIMTSAGIGARRVELEGAAVRPHGLADEIAESVNRLYGFVPKS